MRKRLCTICVRAGSKGVPGKNFRVLRGLPLFVHSINHAKETGLFDFVVISSDSPEILEIAKTIEGVVVIARPLELSQDNTPKIPVLQHALIFIEKEFSIKFDTIVDLDATSPLRSIKDIRDAVNLLENTGCSNVLTVTKARRSPYFNQAEVNSEGCVKTPCSLDQLVTRRQDSPVVYDLNASIYPWQREALLNADKVYLETTKIFEMPEERSLDVDTELDFFIVEKILERRFDNE